MCWNQTDPMTARVRFVLAHQDGLSSMAQLCQRFGVSRKTGSNHVQGCRGRRPSPS